MIVQPYTIQSDKIAKNSGIKIILISDTHSQQFKNGGEYIVETIKNETPDLLFLAGDIIDNKLLPTGSEIFLEKIQHIAPLYYVPGNHEYYNKDFNAALVLIKKFGITILQDDFIALEINGANIIIAGADDLDRKKYFDKNYDWQAASEKAFSRLLEKTEYKILLAHRPNHAEWFEKYNFDLMLCGHTHGGQWRFWPFRGGWYAPDQGISPKYSGGEYRLGSMTLIVSRGLSTRRPLFPRINNPPEIVVIELVCPSS
jgi:predicted MPP superfamily phosphohydrolase